MVFSIQTFEISTEICMKDLNDEKQNVFTPDKFDSRIRRSSLWI